MEIEGKKEYPSIHVLLCQTTKQLFDMVSSNFLHLCVIFCIDIKICWLLCYTAVKTEACGCQLAGNSFPMRSTNVSIFSDQITFGQHQEPSWTSFPHKTG